MDAARSGMRWLISATLTVLLLASLTAACGSMDQQFEEACQRQGIEPGDQRFESCVEEGRAAWNRRMSQSFPSGFSGGP